MNRVAELVAELASGGVSVRGLSDVALLKRGTAITKSQVVEGGVPVIAGGRTPAYFHNQSNRDGQTVVIAGSGAYAGYVSWWEGPIFVSDAFSISPDPSVVDARYCYHWLLAQQETIHSMKTGGGVPHVYAKDVAKLRLPVPPLAIQHEVVSVLDQLTAAGAGLIEALEAELRARRSQHSYYRDSLMEPKSDCEWLTLREISLDFGRGKSRHRPRNDPRLYGGPYPFIQTGDVRSSGHHITEYSQTYSEAGLMQSKLWPKGTICITIAANIAETGVLDFEACFPDSVIGMVVNPERASTDYVEYLLQSLKSNLVAKGKGSAQANINLATFEEVRFPFPSLEEQERIADVLDHLEVLVDSIGDALPAEIAARRKQREYYRDRLFAFPEAAS